MKRFPDNSRVCFVGDSITATYDHVAHIANYYHESFPGCGVRFFNCGVAGGRALSQRTFLKDDTLIHNPTHAVIMLGVNDSERWLLAHEKSPERYDSLKRAFLNYKTELPLLCDELEKAGAQITLCTPAPYAEYQQTEQPPFAGGYALIAEYANFCRILAEKRGYPLCDYHEYLTRILQSESIYGPDHIHPTDKGQYYMAKCFLEFQGMEIGDFSPIPEKFDELRAVSMKVRNIFAVELMITGLKNYDKPIGEKLELVRSYIDEGRAQTDYFKKISAQYLINKPIQADLVKRTKELTEQLMG